MLKILISLIFLIAPISISAQTVMDMEEDDYEMDTLAPDGELEQFEDYVEEGFEETITSDENERVKGFDIAGIMLGMDYEKTREVAKDRKYKLTNIEYFIPEYFTFNYDAICRKHDIFIPENLKGCITNMAKKDKMQYISKVFFKKHDTNEELTVYLTSPITDNKVYKIVYTNDINKKYGDGKNFQYQREERRRAFWYFVLSKYGEPNVEPNKWLLNATEENPTGLTAEFGKLTLENKKQYAFDLLETNKEARKTFKYTDYTF